MQKLTLSLLQSAICLFALSVMPTAQAFSFDDLEKVEKVEKVERDERKVREAKAEKARREEEVRRQAEEARRQAQLQNEEAARQRANSSSSGSSGGYSSSSSGGSYSVHNDKGAAASWAWYKREVVVKCEGGRNDRSLPSVYLNAYGRWEVLSVGKFDTFEAAASAACS